VQYTSYSDFGCTGSSTSSEVSTGQCLGGSMLKCSKVVSSSSADELWVATISDVNQGTTSKDQLVFSSNIGASCQRGDFSGNVIHSGHNVSWLIQCNSVTSAQISVMSDPNCDLSKPGNTVNNYKVTLPASLVNGATMGGGTWVGPSGLLTCSHPTAQASEGFNSNPSSGGLSGGYVALIVILVLACVGALAYFVFKNQQSDFEKQSQQPLGPATETGFEAGESTGKEGQYNRFDNLTTNSCKRSNVTMSSYGSIRTVIWRET